MSGFRSKGKMPKNRHLRSSNKLQNAFTASNSVNWRDTNAKINGLESSTSSSPSTNYGYSNQHLTNAFFSLVGLKIQIQIADGDIYEGLLETVSQQLDVHLSHPICTTNGSSSSLAENDNPSFIIPFKDIVYFKALGVDLEFGKRETITMDNDVSRVNGNMSNITQRELVQWDSGNAGDGEGISGSLEELEMNGNGNFDFNEMLRVNEQQYGIKSTFDESMSTYMTPIENQDTEEHRELEIKAEKLAREMKSESTFQEHELADSGQNEEEMFSAVVRTHAPTMPNQNGNAGPAAINGNTNTNTNANDGFIPARSKTRKNLIENPMGPRLRQQQMRGQDQHGFSPRSSYNPGGSHKNQNGSYSKGSYQSHQVIHGSPSKGHHGNMGNQMQGKLDPSARTLYSTVAMKQQQANLNKKQPGQPNMKQVSMPPPPLMEQGTMIPGTNDMPPPNLSNTSFISNDALKAAKQEVIQNSKNYAAIAKPSVGIQEQQHSPLAVTSSHGSNNRSPLLSSSSIPPLLGEPKPHYPHESKFIDQRSLSSQNMPPGAADISAPGAFMKFGKIIHTASHDEEKNSSDIAKDLKEFSDKFKLSETNTQASKRSPPKTAEVPNRPRPVEKDVSHKTSAAVISGSQPVATNHLTGKPAASISSTVTSSITSFVSCVSVTSTTPTPVVDSKPSSEATVLTSSKLNAAAKEFNPTPKSQVTKQLSYTGGQAAAAAQQQYAVAHPMAAASMPHVSQHQQQPYYSIQPHATSILMSPHEGVAAGAPHQVQQMTNVKPVYGQRPPYYSFPHGATVFSIQTSDLPNNPNNQVFQSNSQPGFIQHQNMNNGPVILMPGANAGNPYGQQQMMHQNQQIFMQSQLVRYASQPPNSAMQHHPKQHYHQQDHAQVQGNVVFVNHQNANYPHPPPSPSPMSGTHAPGQPYVVNQQSAPYQPIASPINHAQGGPMYRPSTPISVHQQMPQQQGQLLMMASHPHQSGGGNIQAVAMGPNNQAYIAGHHGYHQGN